MATVPVEITWVSGQVVTAAQLNANLRDAINFILSPPMAVLRQTVAQSIATATWTGLTWDTEDLDRDGMHSTVTNPTRCTANTQGWFHTHPQVAHGANATAQRALGLRINGTGGTGPGAYKVQAQATSSFETCLATGGAIFLNVGDYVEAVAFQNSGGALSTALTDGNSRMSIRWSST